MLDYLEKLLAHLSWADTAVVKALESTPEPAEGWLELYSHVLGAEHVWLARLKGQTPSIPVWPQLSLPECRRVMEDNHRQLVDYLAALKPSDRGRDIRYTNSAGQDFTSTVEDILLQVCLHGCYHRGQIATAMRQGGAVPAPTDYIGFTRGAPAATRR